MARTDSLLSNLIVYGGLASTTIIHLLLPDIRNIKMFVLDEADEMLSRGFKDQIYDVFRTLNESIQVGVTMTT